MLDDPNFKPKPDSTEAGGTKKLRLARLPGKGRRRGGNPDEPVCIALSSDEEGEDEENSRSSLAESGHGEQRAQELQGEYGLGDTTPHSTTVTGLTGLAGTGLTWVHLGRTVMGRTRHILWTR